jgi:ubiquinone/menaquinone biosynthesis C-methylase UbiE
MLKPEDKPSEKFDLIVCAQVLEHVKDPPSFLKRFYDELKWGGIIAGVWDFRERASQHLKENEKYATTIFAILKEIGFHEVSENYFHFLEKIKK